MVPYIIDHVRVLTVGTTIPGVKNAFIGKRAEIWWRMRGNCDGLRVVTLGYALSAEVDASQLLVCYCCC